MLKSIDANIRKLFLDTILKLRENGTVDCKERRIPKINFEAKYWYEIIDISDEFAMVKPPTSKFLSDDVLKSCIEMSLKPDIIDLPSHSQSVERCVKLVSEASHYVYGFENRHKSILAKVFSGKKRPEFTSKGYYCQDYDDIF